MKGNNLATFKIVANRSNQRGHTLPLLMGNIYWFFLSSVTKNTPTPPRLRPRGVLWYPAPTPTPKSKSQPRRPLIIAKWTESNDGFSSYDRERNVARLEKYHRLTWGACRMGGFGLRRPVFKTNSLVLNSAQISHCIKSVVRKTKKPQWHGCYHYHFIFRTLLHLFLPEDFDREEEKQRLTRSTVARRWCDDRAQGGAIRHIFVFQFQPAIVISESKKNHINIKVR